MIKSQGLRIFSKQEIIGLIQDSVMSKDERMCVYAESYFGMNAMDNGFAHYSERDMQDWYYNDYLPDLGIDIMEGFIQPL